MAAELFALERMLDLFVDEEAVVCAVSKQSQQIAMSTTMALVRRAPNAYQRSLPLSGKYDA